MTEGQVGPFVALWRRIEDVLDESFQLTDRGTSLEVELYAGLVQFVSCLYILPVVSRQLLSAGYGRAEEVSAVATCCAVGCLLASYTTNLPFVIAPPTSVSIFLSVTVQRNGLTRQQANTAVVVSGLFLLLVGVFRSFSRFITKLIPDCIQASTAVGIGLITALAGAIEVGLVVHGSYTLLAMGDVTPALLIAGVSLLSIAVAQHFHQKGAFVIGLGVGSVLFWTFVNDAENSDWPTSVSALPSYDWGDLPTFAAAIQPRALILVFNLSFLYILTLNGLARSLSDLADLTFSGGSIPRGNWLYIFCGATTILSGLLSGPPILISPESAAGIKAGAKTGLSTLVCGTLFGISTFFGPFFSAIPSAATSPLLILVGMVLFQNVSRIHWARTREAVSAFFVLLLIPFTYSIICGIGFGFLVYVGVGLFTGEAWQDLKALVLSYQLDDALARGVLPEWLAAPFFYDAVEEDGPGLGMTVLRMNDGPESVTDPSPPPPPLFQNGSDSPHKTRERRRSRLSVEGESWEGRRRAGSLIDRLSMDLDHAIAPMTGLG